MTALGIERELTGRQSPTATGAERPTVRRRAQWPLMATVATRRLLARDAVQSAVGDGHASLAKARAHALIAASRMQRHGGYAPGISEITVESSLCKDGAQDEGRLLTGLVRMGSRLSLTPAPKS